MLRGGEIAQQKAFIDWTKTDHILSDMQNVLY